MAGVNNRASQYLSIRYTKRPAKAGDRSVVGGTGDLYDNTRHESIIGPFETDIIGPNRPWRNLEEVGCETHDWIGWYNNGRLRGPIGDDVRPAEPENAYEELETDRRWTRLSIRPLFASIPRATGHDFHARSNHDSSRLIYG